MTDEELTARRDELMAELRRLDYVSASRKEEGQEETGFLAKFSKPLKQRLADHAFNRKEHQIAIVRRALEELLEREEKEFLVEGKERRLP